MKDKRTLEGLRGIKEQLRKQYSSEEGGPLLRHCYAWMAYVVKAVEGSMTKQLFLGWLEFNVVSTLILAVLTCGLTTCQLPKCSAYPGPLSVLVMDNAKIHHGANVKELCDQFGES